MPASDDYFDRYTNLQRFKHELLQRYLGAWFPILARSGAARLLYIETHAGKGEYDTGSAGSPLVALSALLQHRDLANILARTKVHFALIEAKEENARRLEEAIARLGTLPDGVLYEVVADQYEGYVRQRLDQIRATGKQLAPAFVFVDPFSFLVDTDLLAGLMRSPQCEILYNFMWENARQAIGNELHATNMDRLFGTADWRKLRDIGDEGQRCEEAARLLKARLGADYHRTMKFYGSRNSIKYVLIHFTKHPLGYRKMNEAMWAVDPGGTFSVSQREDPRTEWVFPPAAPLDPLLKRFMDSFAGQTVEYSQLLELAREVYLDKHCLAAVKQLIAHERAQVVGGKKLVASRNPLIKFK